jgi:hypothetical protein
VNKSTCFEISAFQASDFEYLMFNVNDVANFVVMVYYETFSVF